MNHKYLSLIMCLLLLVAGGRVEGVEAPRRIRALYGSLDPTSVAQHLALYQLYPNSQEGQAALRKAWQLLSAQPGPSQAPATTLPLPTKGIQAIVALVNKHPSNASLTLTEQEFSLVDTLAARLANRRLKGFRATSEAAVLGLPPQDIDLARGLLLSQLGDDKAALTSIRNYEAMLDLMALQILARLPSHATPEDKVREVNRFIFEEMNFRFPPHSVYAKDIDLYTFLPSVLDTRRGVCLGVSVLYLCLAQRLDLKLEIVTPPGHIYVRYRGNGKEINIETTMRGVHVDSDEYLSIDTRRLEQRDLKETIGMAHINQASVYLQSGDYDKGLASYEKALPYLPNNQLLQELLGYSLILTNHEARAKQVLEGVRDYLPSYGVSKNNIVSDYLDGKIDAEGIKCLFMMVDETRQSLHNKRQALQETMEAHPEFRSGWLLLATTLLQMHRYGDAVEALDRFHALDSSNVTIEYFLAAVHAERMDYNKSWEHLHNAETLVALRDHSPKALRMFRRQLNLHAPE